MGATSTDLLNRLFRARLLFLETACLVFGELKIAGGGTKTGVRPSGRSSLTLVRTRGGPWKGTLGVTGDPCTRRSSKVASFVIISHLARGALTDASLAFRVSASFSLLVKRVLSLKSVFTKFRRLANDTRAKPTIGTAVGKCHEEVSLFCCLLFCLPFFFSTGDENVTGIKSLTAPSSVSSHDTRKHRCGELRRPCKILLTAVFPICNGLTAVNIWREGGGRGVWWRWEEWGGVCVQGMVSPAKVILRGAESLLGKIQWLMAGLREAEKPPAKSYELFLSAKYIFFEDCRAIRALLLPFKLFLCYG